MTLITIPPQAIAYPLNVLLLYWLIAGPSVGMIVGFFLSRDKPGR